MFRPEKNNLGWVVKDGDETAVLVYTPCNDPLSPGPRRSFEEAEKVAEERAHAIARLFNERVRYDRPV